ncbi:MAG: hypothetical protein HY369_04630 [Candidatus Aenigmarchaeota archaeon]|nr:hypothetical protein [Candidatus Aenigmarchaeota archaeon]
MTQHVLPDVNIARRAAVTGGQAAVHAWSPRLPLWSKGGVDFLTAADQQAESAVRAYLRQHSPYPIFGEEQQGPREAEKLWVVDAIQGSPGYRTAVPLWGTDVSLLDGETASVCAVYLPRADELYFAERGKGAFFRSTASERTAIGGREFVGDVQIPLKDTTLHVGTETDPAHVTIGYDTGYRNRRAKTATLSRLFDRVQYPYSPGSTSIGAAHVAAGRWAAYVAMDLDINDTIAGALLVEEAGGVAVNPQGERFTRRDRTLILAQNGPIKHFILETFGG